MSSSKGMGILWRHILVICVVLLSMSHIVWRQWRDLETHRPISSWVFSLHASQRNSTLGTQGYTVAKKLALTQPNPHRLLLFDFWTAWNMICIWQRMRWTNSPHLTLSLSEILTVTVICCCPPSTSTYNHPSYYGYQQFHGLTCIVLWVGILPCRLGFTVYLAFLFVVTPEAEEKSATNTCSLIRICF